MKYSLNAGEWNSVFAVPSSVVDRYIKLASAGSLKLILFLMRHGGKEFTDEQLIEALGFRREGELEDAALFWIQRGLIRYDNTSLAAAAVEAPMQIKLPETEDVQPEKKAKCGSFATLLRGLAQLVRRLNAVQLLIKKHGEVRLELSMTAVFLLLILCFWLVLVAAVASMCCGYRFAVRGLSFDASVNAAMDKAGDFVHDVANGGPHDTDDKSDDE